MQTGLSGLQQMEEGAERAALAQDLLCWLCGHHHADTYAYDGGDVPIILFDAYTYANYPLYMMNIDRTQERVNVWKFDEANNIYNYQVPFTEPVST